MATIDEASARKEISHRLTSLAHIGIMNSMPEKEGRALVDDSLVGYRRCHSVDISDLTRVFPIDVNDIEEQGNDNATREPLIEEEKKEELPEFVINVLK